MLRFQLWTICAILAAGFFLPSHSQVIIYESSTEWSQKQYSTELEVGDEVVLAGSARTVTLVRFEYLGQFTPAPDKGAIIRLYANSGPAWMGNTDYLMPQDPPLWESPLLLLQNGLRTADVPVPHIRVGGRVTVTVKFVGLSMTPNDTAGLLIYGDPWIGSSFNDLWEQLSIGWTPIRVETVPRSNLGLSITAIAQNEKPFLSITESGQLTTLQWGESFPHYVLQYLTPPFTDWQDFPIQPTKKRDLFELVLLTEANQPRSQYRLKEIETAEPRLEIVRTNNVAFIRWSAAARNYVLQAKPATGSGGWVDLPTAGATTNASFEFTRRATTIGEFFRLREGLVAPAVTGAAPNASK